MSAPAKPPRSRPAASDASRVVSEAMDDKSTSRNGSGKSKAVVQAETSDLSVSLILDMEGNGRCVDCGAPKPEWISVGFGVVICLRCSGQHRHLGTHITFVQSTSIDNITMDQLHRMYFGGNKRFIEYLDEKEINKALPIETKYTKPLALHYKRILDSRTEGTSEPDYNESANQNTSSSKATTTSKSAGEKAPPWVAGIN